MTSTPTGWFIVVPVKHLSQAKSRLTCPPTQRAALALMMALDTLAAVTQCPRVAGALAVTSDARVATAAARLSVPTIADPGGGLVAAVRAGVDAWRRDRGPVPVAALTADLPCLDDVQLTRALTEAARWPAAFVADHQGTGTTMLAAIDPAWFHPRFGHDSAAAHTAAGAVRIGDDLMGLRHDIDTRSDLEEVTRGDLADHLGPRTRALLATCRLRP